MARVLSPMKPRTPLASLTPRDQQEVARMAYELYERRGRRHGHDLDDWLKAETIVRARKAQSEKSL